MHYAIITNPVSGKMSAEQKLSVLAKPAEILSAHIYGLETNTAEDFAQCARELANRCDVLVTAGGDGTLSDVINAIHTDQKTIAYLPLGSGNSMAYALGLTGNLSHMAMRIMGGKIREYDLINCDGKRRAFMSSVGLEGTVIRLREQYLAKGTTGFKVYLRAVLKAYFGEYKRLLAEISIDGRTCTVKNLLTAMVFKQPYYGYGIKVIPRARFDDGLLHILSINSGLLGCTVGVVTSLTTGNRVGQYRTGREMAVKLQRPVMLQVDGNMGWESDVFNFRVLPKALRIKC